jgi:hypothetical protein
MAERMAAEIWIGGKIPEIAVSDLCAAIVQQGVCLEWGDEFFHPDSGDDLLSAVRLNREGVEVLCLCYEQARWGEFETLEPFLQRYEIPFTWLTAGNYEYDCERVEFRPDSGRVGYVTNGEGEPVISGAKVREVERLLTRALTSSGPRSCKRLETTLQRARSKLRQALPPSVSPLPAFDVEASMVCSCSCSSSC